MNPVDGAVGLLSSGKWHVCQAAVQTVLTGGSLSPISYDLQTSSDLSLSLSTTASEGRCYSSYTDRERASVESNRRGNKETKLLNLFI